MRVNVCKVYFAYAVDMLVDAVMYTAYVSYPYNADIKLHKIMLPNILWKVNQCGKILLLAAYVKMYYETVVELLFVF